MPTCIETFADLAVDETKAKQKAPIIAANHPGCRCETVSVHPEFSPGKVEDHELLLRSIYSPHQFEKDTGQLKPTAFDDAINKGLSVDRMSHKSPEQLRAHVHRKLQSTINKDMPHKFEGVAVISCNLARKILHDMERVFGVYDTATETNRSHADICQIRLGNKIEQRKARLALIEACRSAYTPEADLDKAFTPG